jgi:putative oxidoreductase
MTALAPIGRVLLSLIFILSAPGTFKHDAIAAAAAHGVPMPTLLVPIAGLLALVGGLSVALGYHARLGALALVVFLVPVTLFMHRFWGLDDPQQAQQQMINFMKNLGLLGGAVFVLYAGAGAYSFDAKVHRTGLWGHPHLA